MQTLKRPFTFGGPITINAEFLFEFTSKIHWINTAQETFLQQGLTNAEKTICIDKNGDACNIGLDFSYADKLDLFPIKVYRLIRTSEVAERS